MIIGMILKIRLLANLHANIRRMENYQVEWLKIKPVEYCLRENAEQYDGCG